MIRSHSFIGFFLLITILACAGCAGYRLGSVGGKSIQGVSSVYVPVVKNDTVEPSMDVATTTAIVRAFDKDGTLSTSETQAADSELDVTITEIQREILQNERLDSQAGNQFQVTIVAKVTFTNRKLGRKILDGVTISGLNSYFVQGDQTEAERQALPMAEEDLAKNIVSKVVEGW